HRGRGAWLGDAAPWAPGHSPRHRPGTSDGRLPADAAGPPRSQGRRPGALRRRDDALVTGFYDLTPGRLCAHCSVELSRYRKTYCNNVCREAAPRAFVCNPRGRPQRRSGVTEAFRVALLAMWADGVPIREMGRRLGVTKNSVAGYVHRWKLPPRGTPIPRSPATKSPKPGAPQTATEPADGPRAAPPAPQPTPAATPARLARPGPLAPVQRVEPRPASLPHPPATPSPKAGVTPPVARPHKD